VADPQWTPFLGLTTVVLVLLLALAKASQGVVGDEPTSLPAGSGDGRDRPTGRAAARTVERHAFAEGASRPAVPVADDPPEAAREAPAGDRELTTGTLLANVALTQGLFGGVVLAGVFFYGVPARALGVTGDPWNTGFPAVALGAAFGLVLWVGNEASASIADAVGAAYDEGLREVLAPDTGRGWLVLLGAVLPLIAFVEEFLFRAAIIGVPAAAFGVSPWALAVLSSAVFAVGHGAQGRVGVAVTGGLGFVLAAGYVLSGSLLLVVVAHYLVNALEFLVHEWLGAGRLL